MNFASRIYIIWPCLIWISAAFQSFYPCQYLDLNRDRLKCDLCQCLEVPSKNFSSELCASITQLQCDDPTDAVRSDWNSQLELNHFDDRSLETLFQRSSFCSSWFFSQVTFTDFKTHQFLSPLPPCFLTINGLIFEKSVLHQTKWLADLNLQKLIVINSTLHWNAMNFSSIELLQISSVRFIDQALHLNGSTSLTHLTITETYHYQLDGSFPHLSYLNLAQTNLTNGRWNEILSRIQLPDLNTLILRENQLTSITTKLPSTIRHLDLSHNHIRALDYFSFKSLYSLNLLNLSSNAPLEIQQDTFTRVPYLEVLDLSFTRISLIEDELFLPLQKLRYLNLSGNDFDRFPALPTPYDVHSIDSYDQYLPVLDIDLSKNRFRRFSTDMLQFSSTQDKYILTIHLQMNQIKTFHFTNETRRRGPFLELDFRENPFECHCQLYETVSNLFKSDGKALLSRVKFLHLSELTCSSPYHRSKSSRLLDLQPSTSFCSYKITCPLTCPCCTSSIVNSTCPCLNRCPEKCICAHSVDWMINQVNCSSQQLTEIPIDLPASTTHLDLAQNQIQQIDHRLKPLLNLRYLSLAKNRLESLIDRPFASLTRLEELDVSSNRIEQIAPTSLNSLVELKELYLHDNPWIPRFHQSPNLFQSNIRLNLLTYGTNFSCNRSTVGEALSANDCCTTLSHPSCLLTVFINDTDLNLPNSLLAPRNNSLSRSWESKSRAFILLGSSFGFIFLLAMILIVLYHKRRSSLYKENFLSHQELNKRGNPYDKPLITSRNLNSHSNTIYDHGQSPHHHSLSVTDDDDYASIPLTNSQSELAVPIHPISLAPPLPPPRQYPFNRPISHSSTLSTSTTSRSILPTRPSLQIKVDVLVLYSINDCEYIHQNLSEDLERIYGPRFTFHFIHRDRTLGDLDWFIRNSSVTLLILRKPHHILRDYVKLFSSYATMKCFIIVVPADSSSRTVSLKCREKLARLYGTSNIYDWNSNPNSLVHEQLDLFLELNCSSAT